jgi:hypothetical protein
MPLPWRAALCLSISWTRCHRDLDYRLMLTGMADSFVTDLTYVNRVRQHLIERTSTEANPAGPDTGV